ncbi:hypothetical protein B879_04234 [Cecembia lonarensis LW9]|uniref:Uncharacterized protein n=1 Tax=Cecembia lonarensis (strain CCUG 58316 / KCTC 22772 / LW9) TaxID=1225176 RepID=K1L9U6_CECL9|nr:hypothetical protein B879_04234 [Cecembia lonarensis LW9]
MDGLVRGPFFTHDTLVHESISNCFSINYDAQHPRLTVMHKLTLRFSFTY